MSKVEDKYLTDAGEIRPSQLITNFGPGSVVNMRHDTVMIYGCNWWPKADDKKRYRTLHHELLEKKLKVHSFRMPLSQDRSKNLPCFSFPRWGVCKNNKCQRLQYHEAEPPDENGFVCLSCERNRVKPKDCGLTHARFAVICPKGHIDEFPWVKWVHRSKPGRTCEKSDNPQLTFGTQQKSSALKDYTVQCLSCGAWSSCSGATDPSPFMEMDLKCTGKSPWLKPGSEECLDQFGKETIVRGIQIRAASLWYSINMSALKVPRWLHPVNTRLEDEKDNNKLYSGIELLRDSNMPFKEIVNILWSEFTEVAEKILEQKKRDSDPNSSEEDIKNEIIQRLEEIFDRTESKEEEEIPSQIEILKQEYDDFEKTENTKDMHYEKEFELETSDIDKSKPIFSYLGSLKQIHRITTISALRGFTRGTPPDPLDPDLEKMCEITSYTHLKNEQWYPAVESKGEGIFISLDDEKLSKWGKNEELQKRCKALSKSFAKNSAPHDDEKQKVIMDRFNPKFILLHTLSHLIIKALVEEAGYSEPSIQERIYWNPDDDDEKRQGILIYATGSSEGSLGGLVRLGQSELFQKILENAISKSKLCSRDPVCENTNPVNDMHQTNGASCHSCCFVAETTCKYFNQFLDRWIINDKDAGYFRDLNE